MNLSLRVKIPGALLLCSIGAVVLVALVTPWLIHRRFMEQARQMHFQHFTGLIARYIDAGHAWGGRDAAMDMYQRVIVPDRQRFEAMRWRAPPPGAPPFAADRPPPPGEPGMRPFPRDGLPPPAGLPPPDARPFASQDMRFVLAGPLGYVFHPFYDYRAGQRLSAAERDRAGKLYLHGQLVGYALATGKAPLSVNDRSYMSVLYQSLAVGGGIAALISLLAGLLITLPMLRHLRHLSAAVGRLRPGSEPGQVPVRGHDEIAMLARQFNCMSAKLAEQYDALQASHETIAAQARSLERLSYTDELTGLHNRRYFNAQFCQWLERCGEEDRALSLVILDVDHFKQVNDEFSHEVGDEVLRQLAQLLRECIREQDILARFGGEEIVLLMPDAEPVEAEEVSQRMRRRIEQHDWHRIASGLKVTASFGVIGRCESRQEMLRCADELLYRAKAAGRNRVCVA
jgi:diguanylate cyclase (GGDEF)-like protein